MKIFKIDECMMLKAIQYLHTIPKVNHINMHKQTYNVSWRSSQNAGSHCTWIIQEVSKCTQIICRDSDGFWSYFAPWEAFFSEMLPWWSNVNIQKLVFSLRTEFSMVGKWSVRQKPAFAIPHNPFPRVLPFSQLHFYSEDVGSKFPKNFIFWGTRCVVHWESAHVSGGICPLHLWDKKTESSKKAL